MSIQPIERELTALPVVETPAHMTPMQMAYSLIQAGADLGSVKEMLAMSRELAAEQARQKFDASMSAAKSEITPIIKTATGHNNKKYADFASIAKAVDPIISKHGLSYRFRTRQDDRIHVTCVLAHEAGHAEETTLAGPADATGNKNAIQAIGSTLTYLQRYTLIQALGLAASEDDDGRSATQLDDGELISNEQRDAILALIDEVGGSVGVFCKYLKIEAIAGLPASQFKRAVAALEAKRTKP